MPFRRAISLALLALLVFGGGVATSLAQDPAPLRKNGVPPARVQAVAVIADLMSAIKTGDAMPVFKHFHRAPEWNKKRFENQVFACFELFREEEQTALSTMGGLVRDGRWGPATGIIDKDRLRRRAALHQIRPDSCYALALKDGKTNATFHWKDAKLTILQYDDAARRTFLQEYIAEMVEGTQSTDGSRMALSFFHLGNLGPDAEAAIPALSKHLTSDNADMRMRTALVLWKIDRKPAISLPPILAVLTDREMRVSDRTMAAQCLWVIGPDGKNAVPALEAAMGEDDLKLRTLCAAALWKIAGDSDSTIPVLLLALKGRELSASSAAEKTLADIISTRREDPDQKAAAGQLTRQILEISTSNEVRIRIAAIKVLAQIGGENPSVKEALEKALEDENVRIRTSAASAIKDYERKLQREGREVDKSPEKRTPELKREKTPNPYGK